MGASPGGVVAGVVRFLAHIPLFLYGVNGIQDLKFFQKHATIILQQPLGNVVLVAEKMGGGMGIFAFAWNFVMWIPTTLCPPELLFFVGIVDAGITVSMIAATAIQGGYYGKTNGQCGRLPPAPGTITTDRGLVFLQRLQEISPDDEGYPESTCKHFLLKYYAGVVAIILYSIMTIASLGFGLSAWYDYGTRPRYGAGRSARRQNCFTISNLVYVTTCPLRIPIVALAAVLACLGRCLIGLFPHSIQNKLYFARRWVSKWAVGQQRSAAKVNTKVNTKLSSIPRHVRAKTFRDKSSRASLSKVLEGPVWKKKRHTNSPSLGTCEF
ncbi:uncharacterized protein BDV17DRAFT_113373 [Aspergillus undulatus]|uniref:uncharacterized protein n=1 Tax=Aspergillus undulatus TaxID=1810928 RepID=UPI003CCE36C1